MLVEKMLIFYVPEFNELALMWLIDSAWNTFAVSTLPSPAETEYILIGQL